MAEINYSVEKDNKEEVILSTSKLIEKVSSFYDTETSGLQPMMYNRIAALLEELANNTNGKSTERMEELVSDLKQIVEENKPTKTL